MMENEDKQTESKNEIPIESIDIIKYPITTNTFHWTFSVNILYILLNILSFMPSASMIISFYVVALQSELIHWRIIFIFVDILAWWGLYILVALLLGKLFLIILCLIHEPREGLFKIDSKDNDYKYYCLRTAVKKYIFWVYNNFCFPWASNFAFKICNMRADYKSTMFDGWSDLEFIEYGDNIMIGQGAVVLSSMIIKDYLLIKKVIIGDHVVLGGNAIVAPGTVIGANSTLGVWATTHVGQVLEPGWIYIGRPARKYKSAASMVEDSRKQVVRRIVDTNERLPITINKFIKKDKVALAIEQLDKLLEKWEIEQDQRKRRELKKQYKKERKEITKNI